MRTFPFASLGLVLAACASLPGTLASGNPSSIPTPIGFANPATVHSGIALTVSKGPISPVERPYATNSLPVSGAVVSILTSDGTLVGNLTTDAAGFASASVEPGGYVASVSICPGVMRLASPADVAVVAGQVATVSLECDTGIR